MSLHLPLRRSVGSSTGMCIHFKCVTNNGRAFQNMWTFNLYVWMKQYLCALFHYIYFAYYNISNLSQAF